MKEQPYPEILGLKARFGGRIAAANDSDPNAYRQESPSARRLPYTTRLVFTHTGMKVEVLANEALGCIRLHGTFDVSPFTINAADRIIGFRSVSAGRVQLGSHLYEVFTADGNISSVQREVLQSSQVTMLANEYEFRPGQALHFYSNMVIFYAARSALSAKLVELLGTLAATLKRPDASTESVTLPEHFSKLAKVADEWAIGDDVERSDKMEAASKEELQKLLATVEPERGAIESYLDAFPDGMLDEEAAALARLLEATAEARLFLIEKTKPVRDSK